MQSISWPVIDTEIVCPRCKRKLAAPIDNSVRKVRCPKCGYGWDVRDNVETGPHREICQYWKFEESVAHDDNCDDSSETMPDVVIESPAVVEALDLLIIEDDHGFCYLMRKTLERAGNHVTVCMTAEDGLTLLRQRRFDLITLGQQLPGMKGLELLHTLRSEGIPTPVIMVTGYDIDILPWLAGRAGAVDFVFKDTHLTFLSELPERVREALRRCRHNNKREFLLCDDGFRLCSACILRVSKPDPAAWLQTKTSCGWAIGEILDREG